MATVTSLDTASAPVPGGKYAVSICSFARPDNATVYTALDVISAGSAAALVFPGVGRSGAVRGVSISQNLETDTITPRIWLFDSEPTNIADNAAFALVIGDMPKLVGMWNFVDADKLTVGTTLNYYQSSHEYIAAHPHTDPVPYASADGKLYGLMQTVSGYTPIALSRFTIRVMVEHD